jgi:integrase
VFYRRGQEQRRTNKRQTPARIPSRLLAHLRRWYSIDAEMGVRHVVHYQGGKVRKLRRSWATARDAAGLGNDVIPHTLRHTAATWLMQRGCDIWEAAGYLGMSVEMLEEVYGHHHPDHQKGLRTR